MKGRSLGYLTKEGFRNVWVNRLMSLASVAVLLSCLFMVGCALMLFLNINSILGKMENENVIMAFVADGATQEQAEEAGRQLESLDNVEKSEFVPKDVAYQEQLENYGEDSGLFSGIDENPLPDAYKITVKDLEMFEDTVSKIEQVENIQSVRENRELASNLLRIRNAATFISVAIIAVLLLVSLFIVSNTVRVTMYSRRLEINIMKAVGATNSFVRWPFMIEGVILGIIAGGLSLLVVYGFYKLVEKVLGETIAILNMSLVPFGTYAVYILIGFLAIGIITGAFGSALSMNKYLKEQGGVVSEEK